MDQPWFLCNTWWIITSKRVHLQLSHYLTFVFISIICSITAVCFNFPQRWGSAWYICKNSECEIVTLSVSSTPGWSSLFVGHCQRGLTTQQRTLETLRQGRQHHRRLSHSKFLRSLAGPFDPGWSDNPFILPEGPALMWDITGGFCRMEVACVLGSLGSLSQDFNFQSQAKFKSTSFWQGEERLTGASSGQ